MSRAAFEADLLRYRMIDSCKIVVSSVKLCAAVYGIRESWLKKLRVTPALARPHPCVINIHSIRIFGWVLFSFDVLF